MKKSNEYFEFIKALKNGDICVFETDTVVGIGCALFKNGAINKNNIKKIYIIKNRSLDKPLPWLVSSKTMLNKFAININNNAQILINKNWPGATTFIFEIKDFETEIKEFVKTQNNISSVAFRMPNVEDLINAIDYIDCPVLCTSANISSEKPVSYIKHVDLNILDNVDFIYDKNLCITKDNKPSKIIDCTSEKNLIIRN